MDGQSRHLPSHPAAPAESGGSIGIGRPVARLEDERLLRGGSRYVSDLIATSGALRVKVLRYAVAMTETPVEVPDELFTELRKHFSPQQMVELTSTIAWENYRARFNHAFGIEAAGFADGAVCAVPVGRPRSAV